MIEYQISGKAVQFDEQVEAKDGQRVRFVDGNRCNLTKENLRIQ